MFRPLRFLYPWVFRLVSRGGYLSLTSSIHSHPLCISGYTRFIWGGSLYPIIVSGLQDSRAPIFALFPLPGLALPFGVWGLGGSSNQGPPFPKLWRFWVVISDLLPIHSECVHVYTLIYGLRGIIFDRVSKNGLNSILRPRKIFTPFSFWLLR